MAAIIYDIYHEDNDTFQIVVNTSRWAGSKLHDDKKDHWYLRTQSALKYRTGKAFLALSGNHDFNALLYQSAKSDFVGVILFGVLNWTHSFNDEGEGQISSDWNFKFQAQYPRSIIRWQYAGTL